ncbi:hypothetical protein [Enterococcus mundtii]|uniref:hypothetical protein n=1 Tax=Enterococcus mundtii TaxID=53346 RepID=UPI001A957390|nr:hypothetical protein [Enterococcus mundtii]
MMYKTVYARVETRDGNCLDKKLPKKISYYDSKDLQRQLKEYEEKTGCKIITYELED